MKSFASDFGKRLEPQPGMKVVYARTRFESDRDQVRKLFIGYSDDVSVFLNGKILASKRRRGRPPKVARPEDQLPEIPIPEHLRSA